MRKVSLIFILTVFAYSFLTTTVNAEEKPLIISQDAAWPPFSYLDSDGQPQGLIIDLWKSLGRQINRDIEFKLVDWNESLQQVNNGSADIHGGLFFSPARDEFLDFSRNPLFELSASLFVSSSLEIASMDEITDHPLGIVKGGFEEEFVVNNYPKLTLMLFDNNEAMIEAAYQGKVALFVADYPVGLYYLNQKQIPERFFAKQMLYSNNLKIAVKQDNTPLLAAIDRALSQFPDAERDRILQKWLVTIDREVIPAWLITAFLIVILLIVSITLFSYTYLLKKQVNRRTEELLELNQEYVALAAKAEKANQAKTQFLAKITHELRTPMHAIMSFSTLGLKATEDEKLTKFFTNIQSSGKRLTNLIDDLLDISKLESGKISAEFKNEDITKVIRDTVQEIHSLINDKHINMLCPAKKPVFLHIDHAMMTQVIVNLLSNAIKFSPDKSTITITIEDMHDKVQVSFSDEGIGIPGDELNHIFDTFTQSSRPTDAAKGTGLGLPICKELIDLHNGKIWAESPPRDKQHGSTFIFSLPKTQP